METPAIAFLLSAFILAALLAAPLVILHTLQEKTAFESGLLMEIR